MAQLFKRQVRLIVDGLLIEDLRVQFKVKKTSDKTPNSCEASIYNLNPDHRAAFQKKGLKIILEAGYGSNTAQIFSGASRFTDATHEGPDWVTKIECADGETAYKYTQIKESFAPGTPRSTVFQKIAGLTGLDVREAINTVNQIADQFTRGYTAFGKAGTEIDRLLRGTGYDWSIQDGRLQVVPENGTTKDAAILVSPSTGLIGSPAHGAPIDYSTSGVKKPQVLKVKSLLQAGLRPAGRIKLESASQNGVFRILDVTHTGDTHGGEFYSELEVVPT